MSVIDDLFCEIYGYKPNKDGQAYEMLASAVLKLLTEKSTVIHDERLRGNCSETLYQLDLLLKNNDTQYMGEAKDYTERASKVGRSDIQKLAGALTDLNVEGGLFFSATDYTGPAQKYANATVPMIGKEIKLFHLRPSVERDEQGRVKKIIFSIHLYIPDYAKAKFIPVWTNASRQKGQEIIDKGLLRNGQSLRVDTIYHKDGTMMTTVRDLTALGFGGEFGSNAQGSFILPGGHVQVGEYMLEIHGIMYDVPFIETVEDVVIEGKGIPKLFVKEENGAIDKLITDIDLKRVLFTADGEAKLNG